MNNEILKDAFRQAIDQKYGFLNNDEEIVFSDGFSRKMEKLIKIQSGSTWHMFNSVGKKIAIIIIGIIIAITGSLSVKAIRDDVIGLIKEIYEKYISMYFDGKTSLIIEDEYYISYVPSDYELLTKEKNDAQVLFEYSNPNGDIISMTQTISDGTIIKNDNEHLTNSTIMINDKMIQIATGRDYIVAVWAEKSYVIRIEFFGEISLKEAEKVISSVKEGE